MTVPPVLAATPVPAVAVAPTSPSPAPSASPPACHGPRQGVPYTITGRHHISCKAAKPAFKAYSPSHPHGYSCSPKQITFSGKCHKGTKRFTYTASQGQQQGKRG